LRAATRSRRELARGYFLDQATIDWMLGHYCGAEPDIDDPRLSPLRAPRFSCLPPAHIHTAEFDPLRDEGETHGEKLRAAGVPVTVSRYEGMIHGFFSMYEVLDKGKLALEESAEAIRKAFSR
jgi:acetyl esterase/lipase